MSKEALVTLAVSLMVTGALIGTALYHPSPSAQDNNISPLSNNQNSTHNDSKNFIVGILNIDGFEHSYNLMAIFDDRSMYYIQFDYNYSDYNTNATNDTDDTVIIAGDVINTTMVELKFLLIKVRPLFENQAPADRGYVVIYCEKKFISPAEFNKSIDIIQHSNFSSLNDTYWFEIDPAHPQTDRSYQQITLNINGTFKTVTYASGDMPKSYYTIYTLILNLWIENMDG